MRPSELIREKDSSSEDPSGRSEEFEDKGVEGPPPPPPPPLASGAGVETVSTKGLTDAVNPMAGAGPTEGLVPPPPPPQTERTDSEATKQDPAKFKAQGPEKRIVGFRVVSPVELRAQGTKGVQDGTEDVSSPIPEPSVEVVLPESRERTRLRSKLRVLPLARMLSRLGLKGKSDDVSGSV